MEDDLHVQEISMPQLKFAQFRSNPAFITVSQFFFNRCRGCSLNIVFFPRILESLPPLPHQHSAAIGCTKNYQPIGVTVHSHCVESFGGLLQRCRRGRGCSELGKKHNFSSTHCTSQFLKGQIVERHPNLFDGRKLCFYFK